jgi:hypothetical protein
VYLLYLDESGSPDDPADRHFVLAGAAVFERVTYFLSQDVDAIQTRHFPNVQPIAFHATDIRSGNGFWRNVERAKRDAVLRDLGGVLRDANEQGVLLFAAVVEKTAALHGEGAVRCATEQVCKKFDIFLTRRFHEAEQRERGLIVFAESRFHYRSRVWVQGFRELGTQWGSINNLADIPYFATPKESRLLQVADLVAHATFLLFERRNPDLIRPFIQRFDQREGILHGLAHVTENRQACQCPGCHSRRQPYHFGPWF